ncbi:MAG: hypothetical protein IPJ00_20425 [Saprospirales bacterium]|nr:hypothetical protein [Saprospirales bacterium]
MRVTIPQASLPGSIVDQGYVANYVDSALVELYSVVLSSQNNTSDRIPFSL